MNTVEPGTQRVLNRRCDPIPQGAVYIGRPGPWGNPFRVGVDGDRAKVLRLYKHYLWSRVQQEGDAWLEPLRGHDLVCWCEPQACHGHVIRAYFIWKDRKEPMYTVKEVAGAHLVVTTSPVIADGYEVHAIFTTAYEATVLAAILNAAAEHGTVTTPATDA